MESAKKLLGFDFDADAFDRRALQLMKIRPGISNLLKKIVDECDSRYGSPGQESLEQVYLRFIDTPPRKLSKEFDTPSRVRKLSRVLTYSEFELPRIVDDKSGLKEALRLIDLHFSIRTMLNVFETLLQVWDTTNTPMLQAFIKKHLIDYEGPRKLVLRLKSDIAWYCENDSPAQLAKHLLCSQVKLSDVWSYLKLEELPDPIHGYHYFGAVAEAFIVYNKYLEQQDSVTDIVNFLTKHNNKKTSRVILPKLIARLGSNASENLRAPIQYHVLREWGDPRIADTNKNWRDVSNETWRIFRQWIMKADLCFFYDVVAKRSEAKDFWLPYFGKISSCRIVLGRNAERLFGKDRYYQKQKRGMAKLKDSVRNQHALIIQMGHKTFVEFSIGNVCYIYDNTSFPFNLSESEYDIQSLADKLQAKDCVVYNNSLRTKWRVKLDSLIKSEVGIDLLRNSQLGRW